MTDDEDNRPEFIEEVGIHFESAGQQRMAGRIFALLLVSDESMLSSMQIAEKLQASKASVSTVTRMLLQHELIERVARAGDRKDYFRVKSWSFDLMMDRQLVMIGVFRKLLEKARSLIPASNHAGRDGLEQMINLYNFLEKEIPALKERWNRRKA